ncbi:MAG: hypothetical protein QHJ81_02010 [Anaerolineae bacterium]|nr:hypothetical protein [Anaerolineae bacterium]
MAKKSKARGGKKKRKTARPPQQRPAATRPVTDVAVETPQPVTTRQTKAPVRTAEPKLDFAREYGYVYSDLKRVGIIAAAMLVLLVILAFVIT